MAKKGRFFKKSLSAQHKTREERALLNLGSWQIRVAKFFKNLTINFKKKGMV